MNTPKTLKLTSKYLTPCRTLGLKRKSTSPRTPVGIKLISDSGHTPLHSNKKPRSLNNIENISPNDTHPLEESSTKTDIKPEKCLEKPIQQKSNTPRKENSIEGNKIDEAPFGGFVSEEDLTELIETINNKISQVNSLQTTQIYSKKHDLNELRQSTKKWKDACKEVLYAIHEELKEQQVSMALILEEHNIPFNSIGFNEDTMDFN